VWITGEARVLVRSDFLPQDSSLREKKALWYADDHSMHLFGILQSKKILKDYHQDPDLLEGLGGPRVPMDYLVTEVHSMGDETEITYTLRGKFLIHKSAAQKWLEEGSFKIPLPYNYNEIYDEKNYKTQWQKCSDKYYSGMGDFPYFFDPYKPGCEALAREPLAKWTTLHVSSTLSETKERELEEKRVPFVKIRGDNGNGDLLSVYVVHGYYENFKKGRDDGRRLFNQFGQRLVRHYGFEKETVFDREDRVRNKYTREMVSEQGRHLNLELHHLLTDTNNDKNRKTFPRFWKEAVEKGDVIIYGGHSSLGVGPDLKRLKEILSTVDGETITFTPNKHQIYFLDACSSYSWYLEPYRSEGREELIDIISYGLPSYYHYAVEVMDALLEPLYQFEEEPTWLQLLTRMEEVMWGESYLINVGAL